MAVTATGRLLSTRPTTAVAHRVRHSPWGTEAEGARHETGQQQPGLPRRPALREGGAGQAPECPAPRRPGRPATRTRPRPQREAHPLGRTTTPSSSPIKPAEIYEVTALASTADHRQQQPVSLSVRGHYEPTARLPDRSAVDSGDDTTSGLAQSNAGREVHAPGQVTTIGDVCGAAKSPAPLSMRVSRRPYLARTASAPARAAAIATSAPSRLAFALITACRVSGRTPAVRGASRLMPYLSTR